MNFSFSEASREFDTPQPVQPVQRGLPTQLSSEYLGDVAVGSTGPKYIDLEYFEPPQLWWRLIEQADLCLEHARAAEQGMRFSAACGLILTAQELLRRSLSIECSTMAYLTLERAVIERMNASRIDLDRLLDLAVQNRLIVA